eukprot:g14050.t1
MLTRGKRRTPWDVVVCHSTPDVWHEDGAFSWGRVEPCPPVGTKHSIGRSMYETDALPETWVPRLNRMDEVWVPSHFGLEHFVSSGVQRNKIAVVPEAVDTDLFDPAAHEALELGGTEGLYRFLSVFKWEKRKDDVILVIKTQAFHSDDDFHNKVLAEISKAQEAGGAPDQPARYKLLSEDLTLKDLPRLYQAADAFVLPSRGEGWGRPHVEAMAMNTDKTNQCNWGGVNSYLLYALPEDHQDTILSDLQSFGLKAVRVWVAGVDKNAKGTASPFVPHFEPKHIGEYDYTVLNMIDKLMLKAQQYGIKLIIALHDRYALGCWSCDGYQKDLKLKCLPEEKGFSTTGCTSASRGSTTMHNGTTVHVMIRSTEKYGRTECAALGNVLPASWIAAEE